MPLTGSEHEAHGHHMSLAKRIASVNTYPSRHVFGMLLAVWYFHT